MAFLQSANLSAVHANESNAHFCSINTDKTGELIEARALFQSHCATYTLVDCDPVNDGGWQCSSDVIDTNAHGAVNTKNTAGLNTAAPATRIQPAKPTTPPEPVVDPDKSSDCYVVATGFNQAKITFAQKCANYPRRNCDPLGNNQWVCSSANVTNQQHFGDADSSQAVTAHNNAPSANRDLQSNNTISQNQTNQDPLISAPLTNTQVGRLGSNDLLALHYDNCPDKDDGHAIPAGKSVIEKYDINNVLAVNGTCGNSIRDRFNSSSNTVMKASWGTQYLDAHSQHSVAIAEAATRWASTLSNGADVWVAEGGQSDFTADVVRQIELNYSNIDLKRIHVIQHSAGKTAYNEKFTDASNGSYLKNKTSYKAIANGNVGGNGTANLNQQSNYFVISARASRFSAEWNAGFQYLVPDCSVRTENCKLDFSDTVELLYIIDDTSTQNVNDFANRYLN